MGVEPLNTLPLPMVHTPSDVVVYKTTHYPRFEFVTGNREIVKSKVKRIVKEIMRGNDKLPYFPILVSEDAEARYMVIDGQHRLEAAKHTKKPIYYILYKDPATTVDIATMNSIPDKWKVADFLNAYRDLPDYKILEEYHDRYDFPWSFCIMVLQLGTRKVQSGGAKEALRVDFQTGHFKVAYKRQAEEIAKNCMLFEKFLYWNTTAFALALIRIQDVGKADLDVLVEKFNANPEALTKAGTPKEYCVQLESIYNRHARTRETIF